MKIKASTILNHLSEQDLLEIVNYNKLRRGRKPFKQVKGLVISDEVLERFTALYVATHHNHITQVLEKSSHVVENDNYYFSSDDNLIMDKGFSNLTTAEYFSGSQDVRVYDTSLDVEELRQLADFVEILNQHKELQ